MKTISKSACHSKIYIPILIMLMIFLLLHTSFNALAQNPLTAFNKDGERSSALIAEQTKAQLSECRNLLNYPRSVERFYKLQSYKLAWVEKDNHSIQLDPAMMLLDGVYQFGLNKQDFHPTELLYKQIKVLTEQSFVLGDNRRASLDILLTDAIITFINQLHYGKFNTNLTPSKTDSGGSGDLDAVSKLTELLKGKDFYTEIIKVQPLSKEYHELQTYMLLVRGQYMEDNYEFPEESVRKMAINMERLRWLSTSQTPNLIINIPAYTAKLKLKDSTYLFKVIVGKPSSPTPIVESSITHFTVAPDLKVPLKTFVNQVLPKAINNANYLENNHYAIYDAKGRFVEITRKKLLFIKAHPHNYSARQSTGVDDALGKIVFYFANSNDIDLHDTPQPKLLLLPQRAISNGCIGIDKTEKLAGLLLAQDGTPAKIPMMHKLVSAYQKKDFLLKTPFPITLVYLTCEMNDSQVVIYKDIYAEDKSLERAMYGSTPMLALDRKIIKKPQLDEHF
ncbi:murein L,D-transpeptidase YcbB/YkuD [Pedobacter sp. UYP30]|uniref:L,D-transpeptidase family protein n=1 Tax=Pedobacter sp. UYP30 TaxID=1756400 RepID=UPI00339966F1